MGVSHMWAANSEGSNDASDADRFTMRLPVPSGLLSADQLAVLHDVARQYGTGFVQIGPRQVLEVPGLHVAHLSTAQAALAAVGLVVGDAEERVRNVVACTGSGKCVHAFLDSRSLGTALQVLFAGEEMSPQVRIAVAGCPSGCTAPQMADIGFTGTVEPTLNRAACQGCGACAEACDEKALVMRRGLPRRDPERCDYCGACVVSCPPKALRPGRLGYTVTVGGRMGRRPQAGSVLARFVAEDEALDVATRVLSFLRDNGQPRERLHSLLRRVGIDRLRTYVHSRPLHRTPVR